MTARATTRPALTSLRGWAAAVVLAQLVGCGSCVKDEAPQAQPGDRKPLNLKAADKRLSHFSEAGASDDASADASHD